MYAALRHGVVAVVVFCQLVAWRARVEATRPNIVFYLADDVGSGSLTQHAPEWSFVDNTSALEAIPEARRIHTPTLELMARQGKRFLRAYAASPICAPSRHSLITGISTGHQYVRGNGYGDSSADVDIQANRTTMAKVLSAHNYSTYAVGKWGVTASSSSSGSPCYQGFDKFFGKFTHASLGEAFPQTMGACNASSADSPETITYTENADASEELCFGENSTCTYMDLAFREQALSWIDEAVTLDKPFFLYWATTAGHSTNWEYVENRNNAKHCVLRTHPVLSYGRYTVENLNGTGRTTPEIRGLMSMMEYTIDEDLRYLLAKLKEHGQENNTLIVFSSDNGAHREAYADADYDPAIDFYGTGGLKGLKRYLHSGGTRVPFLAWWPGQIPAGTVSYYPIALYDMPLTFASFAGIANNDSSLDLLQNLPGHGMDLKPIFISANDTASGFNSTTRSYVYTEMCFISDGVERPADQVCPVTWNKYAGCGFGLFDLSNWPNQVLKLVQNVPRQGSFELYDVLSDPFEASNLTSDLPDDVDRLTALLPEARTPSCLAESAYIPYCYDDPCNLWSSTNKTECESQEDFLCEWTSSSDTCSSYTYAPTGTPTNVPTLSPTPYPTRNPSPYPTTTPTGKPTNSPTDTPTKTPTSKPTTLNPTQTPTHLPTTGVPTSPTVLPTQAPVAPTPSTTRDTTAMPTTIDIYGEDANSPSSAGYISPSSFVANLLAISLTLFTIM